MSEGNKPPEMMDATSFANFLDQKPVGGGNESDPSKKKEAAPSELPEPVLELNMLTPLGDEVRQETNEKKYFPKKSMSLSDMDRRPMDLSGAFRRAGPERGE